MERNIAGGGYSSRPDTDVPFDVFMGHDCGLKFELRPRPVGPVAND